jgi:hypothetical protein
VDQDGDVIDILLQSHRDQPAADRFLRRLLRSRRGTMADHHRQAAELGVLPVVPSCRELPTIPNPMPTIAPRFRISPLG